MILLRFNFKCAFCRIHTIMKSLLAAVILISNINSIVFCQGQFTGSETWNVMPNGNLQNIRVGDVNGDGKTDVIALHSDGIFVRRSDGNSFLQEEKWSTIGEGNFWFGDVNGDGKDDAVYIHYRFTTVLLSTGTSFGPPETWESREDQSTTGSDTRQLLGDVNGDGMADVLKVGYNGVAAYLSTGSSFAAPTMWHSENHLYSDYIFSKDVNGDSRADLITVLNFNGGLTIWVDQSSGSSFAATSAVWFKVDDYGFSGVVGLHDFNGDLKLDLMPTGPPGGLIVNSDGTRFDWENRVLWSTSETFYTPSYVADVTGDGKADLIYLRSGDIVVRRAKDCNNPIVISVMPQRKRVVIRSTQSILLRPGVQVKAGNFFSGKVESCEVSTTNGRLPTIDLSDAYLLFSPFDTLSPLSGVATEKEIFAFPNPATQSLTLILKQPVDSETSLEIFDKNSKRVRTEKIVAGQSNFSLNVSYLPRGIYYLRIRISGRTSVTRIVLN